MDGLLHIRLNKVIIYIVLTRGDPSVGGDNEDALCCHRFGFALSHMHVRNPGVESNIGTTQGSDFRLGLSGKWGELPDLNCGRVDMTCDAE